MYTSRRQFLQDSLALAGFGLLAGCGVPAPFVPQPAGTRTIGYLSRGALPGFAPWLDAFREGLEEQGQAEGRTYAIEARWADEKEDQFPSLVADLLRQGVDVILAEGTPASVAAKQATDSIPIVMAGASDPIGTGLVASLARPGGNVTGVSTLHAQTSAKRLELLRDTLPTGTRVAVFTSPPNPAAGLNFRETEAAARALGVPIVPIEVRTTDDFDPALDTVAGAGVGGLLVLCDTLTPRRRRVWVDFAARAQLPAIFEAREYVEEGALMGHGPNFPTIFRRAAGHVDKILKGARPAELPVEQPTSFDFTINLRTAQALGLTIPPSVLAQATEVMQ
jgi:putative ABC transport system substrate-binding protein